MDALREQISRFLDWREAHATFDNAVADFPVELRGVVPSGLPYSAWQLIEHIRIAQRDILDFCRNPEYVEELKWPDEYWPTNPEPPDEEAWDNSIAAYHADLDDLKALALDPSCDLFALVPAGSGQTFLREFLVVADHATYHIGQIILVRRFLANWTEQRP